MKVSDLFIRIEEWATAYPTREDAQFAPNGMLPRAEVLARLCCEELEIDSFWIDEVQSTIFDTLFNNDKYHLR